MIPLRQWRAHHLFRSWLVYWAGLLAVSAWRPLLEYWRITRSPSGHGSVSYSFQGTALSLALWIAAPPLLLFLVWLATRTREPRQSSERMRE